MADAYRSSVNRANSLTRWDKVADRTAETQPMRDGRRARLREQVLAEQPHLQAGRDDAEIEDRIDRKLRIHLERARAASLKTRRENAAAKKAAARAALDSAIESALGAGKSAPGADEAA